MGEDKTPDTTEPKDETPKEDAPEAKPSAPDATEAPDTPDAAAPPVDTSGPESTPSTTPSPSHIPDYIRFPLVLAVVSTIAALSLAGVYRLTRAKIAVAEGRKVDSAFASVLGDKYGSAVDKGSHVELRDAGGATVAYAAQVECDNSYNAGEPIKLMVVMDAKLRTVLGIRVISSKETPGFGERINDTVAPKSLFGIVAGREQKSRVVLAASGARVGVAKKNEDGSVSLVRRDGATETFAADKVASVTSAPFPPAFVDQFTGTPVQDAKKLGGRIDALTGATITSRAIVGGVAKAASQLEKAISGN